MSVDGAGSTAGGARERLSPTGVLRAVGRRLRAAPARCVPFTVAGVVVALADWLRLRDPLPVAQPAWVGDTVSVQYALFPSGTARTSRHLGAFLDLRLPYLVGGLTLEAVVALAVGTAGWLTITRSLSADRTAASFGRYVAGLGAMLAFGGLLPVRDVELASLPLALLAAAVLALVAVRLFLLPGLLAAGSGVTTALVRSVRLSRGTGATLFWLVLVFGLVSWALAIVPVVGGFLSTAVVGTVHAVALAVVLGHLDDEAGASGERPGRP
ncbi:hypothetical protein [Haloarcula onubensis]|uniref:Uncharacterized protein n=1 Tax=Haloarcula onubensis TaxID=2950539 RepID=A0ABU2FKU2_9EURY|nr:hypothetical protein [Halomicroarcula sp. S3CR25-11]MDS0280976.1 hypothetical protein [Halomicroarcula sp. S3CR25-11]